MMTTPQLQSAEALALLDQVRDILFENETLKNANAELIAHSIKLSSRIAELNIRLANLQTDTSQTQQRMLLLDDTSSGHFPVVSIPEDGDNEEDKRAQPHISADIQPKSSFKLVPLLDSEKADTSPEIILPQPLQHTIPIPRVVTTSAGAPAGSSFKSSPSKLVLGKKTGKATLSEETQNVSCAAISMGAQPHSPPEYTPLSTSDSKGLLRRAVKTVSVSLGRGIRQRLMMTPETRGFTWKKIPTSGFMVMPANSLLKSGITEPNIKNDKYRQNLDLVVSISGQWCYMGTFKAVKETILEANDFLSLSSATKAWVINKTGGKSVRRNHNIGSMYASGQLNSVLFHLQRIGFDEILCGFLQDALAACTEPKGKEKRLENGVQEESEING